MNDTQKINSDSNEVFIKEQYILTKLIYHEY